MGKRDLSEADVCAKFITPAVIGSGWDEQTQIQREVHFTARPGAVPRYGPQGSPWAVAAPIFAWRARSGWVGAVEQVPDLAPVARTCSRRPAALPLSLLPI
jgi:hypothetical protein